MPRDVAKIYVGNLGRYGNSDELHREFSHYGDVKNVWVARQPPGFAFVEMSDYSDAEYAVMKLHERIICGQRVRVEMSHGRSSSNKFSSERRRRRSSSYGRGSRRSPSYSPRRRSPSYNRRRSPSYSRRRDHSRSSSRSYSPRKSRSYSP